MSDSQRPHGLHHTRHWVDINAKFSAVSEVIRKILQISHTLHYIFLKKSANSS